MRVIGFILALGVVATSCWRSGENEDIAVFEDSTMVKIMTDAFILHAAFSDTYGAVKDSISEVYTKQLFEKYDISREEFEFNVDRVFEDPMLADSIFQLIIKRVDDLESKLDIESLDQNPLISEQD